jgi:subtilisin family serine protease
VIYCVLAILLLLTGVASGQECSGRGATDICEADSPAAARPPRIQKGKPWGRSPRIHAAIARLLSAMQDRSLNAHDTSIRELSNAAVRLDEAGAIHVYVILGEFRPEYVARLEALGLRVEITLPEFRLVQGWIPSTAVDAVAALDFVQQVKPPGYPMRKGAGAVTTEGDALVGAADARAAFNVSGAGVTIGVISGGVTHLADSVGSGDLPAKVQVLRGGSGDEGTAILEVVHDVAPGAGLAFYEPETSADMVAGIGALAAAGARVVVDDLIFFDEPKFEDGMIAQTARRFATAGRLYVTAAGNAAQTHYRSTYHRLASQNPPPGSYPALHNYAPGGVDIGNTLVIPSGCGVTVILQWNNPFGASADDFDLLLARSDNGLALAVSAAFQTGTQDPYERVDFTNLTPDPITAFIAVAEFELTSPSASLILDYFVHADCGLLLQYVTSADSVIGHEAVDEVLSVAAITATNQAEPFSSQGPGSISFPGPEMRNVPNISAVDCVATRVGQLGFFVFRFCGTSAAAPHVAGVAALLIEHAPSLSSEQLRAILTGAAVDLGPGGFDPRYGFGRADGLAALQAVSSPGPQLALGLALDRDSVRPNDGVQVSITASNSGGAALQDLYVVILVPAAFSTSLGCPAGDALVFLADAFATAKVVCRLSEPAQSYAPLYRNVSIPAALPLTVVPDLFRFAWPPETPGGTYTFVIFTTPPDAFADGDVGPADISAFASDSVEASP